MGLYFGRMYQDRTSSSASGPSQRLHLSLWIVQILLGVFFAMVGVVKMTTPMAELPADGPSLPEALLRFIGASEFAGGLGLVLPAATRIKAWLTPLAGLGLAVIMLLALAFHASRGEWASLPMNLVLGGLAVFVAWGRSKKALIEAR